MHGFFEREMNSVFLAMPSTNEVIRYFYAGIARKTLFTSYKYFLWVPQEKPLNCISCFIFSRKEGIIVAPVWLIGMRMLIPRPTETDCVLLVEGFKQSYYQLGRVIYL